MDLSGTMSHFRQRQCVVVVAKAPYNEDRAVFQQCCRVMTTCAVEVACGSPGAARRIVQFTALGKPTQVKSTGNKNQAVWEQSRRVPSEQRRPAPKATQTI